MKISKLFKEKKAVFSFEIFPPNNKLSVDKLLGTIEKFKDLSPDFISVTYGAGGSLHDNKTCELSSIIKNKYGIEALAHLTCINSTKEEVDFILERLKHNNIENVLALRGDITSNSFKNSKYKYSTDIISEIKSKGDFGIAGACYPEGHTECTTIDEDIDNLKKKVDLGAEHLISQLFFDNNIFYDFLDKTSRNNINVPIQAGIMPVINKKQIERILSLCGATFPKKFMNIVNKYEHDKEALMDAGIAYAIEQIIDLVSDGVDGIHLYTMNNPHVARRITEATRNIFGSINKKVII